MRRQYREVLPLLMRLYPGVTPWNLDRFTRGELTQLVQHAAKMVESQGG